MPLQNRIATAAAASVQIGDLPLRAPVHIDRETSLQDAALLMRAQGVSSLVVDSQPAAFVTERDLVHAIADGRALTEPVRVVATRSPVWVPPTLTVAHAAALMVGVGIRHLVVVDTTGHVSGVLSIRDAFEALLPALEPDAWLATFGAALRDVG